MISLDTNVVIRVVTADDAEQLAVALKVMRLDGLWLCKTALLEIEWVLRYSYRLSPQTIREAIIRLLGYPNLTVEEPATVEAALDLYAVGMDFGDSLHLASSRAADRFVTFDRALAKVALETASVPPVELLRPD